MNEEETKSEDRKEEGAADPKGAKPSFKVGVAGKERIILWLVISTLVAVSVWQFLRIVRLENAVLQILAKPNPAQTAGNVRDIKRKIESLRGDAVYRIPERPGGARVMGMQPSSIRKDAPQRDTQLAGKALESQMAKSLGADAPTAGEVLEILSRETQRRRSLQKEFDDGSIPKEHFIAELKSLRAETDKEVKARLTKEQYQRYLKMRQIKKD